MVGDVASVDVVVLVVSVSVVVVMDVVSVDVVVLVVSSSVVVVVDVVSVDVVVLVVSVCVVVLVDVASVDVVVSRGQWLERYYCLLPKKRCASCVFARFKTQSLSQSTNC